MSEGLYHVSPEGDLMPHVLVGVGCWCKPDVADGVVVHHSADGRELDEMECDRLNCSEVNIKREA